jgi:DNA repair exonuclease SbcCD ATPase subunit
MAKDIDSKVDYIHDKLDEIADACQSIDKEVSLQKAAFDEHIKQDEKMYEEFKRMNDILQQNTDSLKEHMHRTDLLEHLVKKMDERFTPIELTHIESRVIEKYKSQKKAKRTAHIILITKIVSGVAAAIGLAVTLKAVLGL